MPGQNERDFNQIAYSIQMFTSSQYIFKINKNIINMKLLTPKIK